MRIPRRIIVGGHEIEVKRSKRIQSTDEDAPETRIGEARDSEKDILLATHSCFGKLSESYMAQTFLHEIMHHVASIYLQRAVSEKVIGGLSEGLFQVLRTNKLDFSGKE